MRQNGDGMKIIHTSDIHLASPLTTRLTPSAARERKKELTLTFRRIIEDAERAGAEALIIAGDLFDNERVSARAIDEIMGIIEKCHDLTFFYLPGNHEKDRILESGVNIPRNLKIFGEDWTYFKLGEVTIVGRREICDDAFSALTLNEDEVNLVVLHGELSERTKAPDKIGTKDIEALPIDYLALGHYHSYSATNIGKRTTAVYCGTPEGRGFDEAGDKGYVVVDTNGKFITHRFKKSAARTMRIIEVDISDAERHIELEDRVSSALTEARSEDLVRVVLIGEHAPGVQRDTESLEKRFSPSFFYFEVKDKSRLKISPDEYKNDKSLKGEFIRLVMSKDGLTDEEKEAVIECGIRALAGETV